MRSAGRISSPKQKPSDPPWYPYYAGFAEDFVHGVLRNYLNDVQPIIDPWSGSGTTTAVCRQLQMDSVGVDINPALTVIARARLTPTPARERLDHLGAQISDAARRLRSPLKGGDLLQEWIRPTSVARIRALQDAIHFLLIPGQARQTSLNMIDVSGRLPVLACFFYCALFAVVRDLLARFVSSNPTWLNQPESHRNRIAPSWDVILTLFRQRIQFLGDRLSVRDTPTTSSRDPFQTGSATALPFETDSFDAALTSPPYATRIDYVRGTLPELAVLGASQHAIEHLRRVTTGTPVVRGWERNHREPLVSLYGESILQQIRNHHSKGSSGYYFPWMAAYLQQLEGGIRETGRVVRGDGRICIVVQDSHYKTIHVDLQRIVIETLASFGRDLLDRTDFPVSHVRSHMNPRARRHLRTRHHFESLLVFG